MWKVKLRNRSKKNPKRRYAKIRSTILRSLKRYAKRRNPTMTLKQWQNKYGQTIHFRHGIAIVRVMPDSYAGLALKSLSDYKIVRRPSVAAESVRGFVFSHSSVNGKTYYLARK